MSKRGRMVQQQLSTQLSTRPDRATGHKLAVQLPLLECAHRQTPQDKIKQYHRSIMALKDAENLREVRTRMDELLGSIAADPARGDGYAAVINELLMRCWTRKGGEEQTRYDAHMAEHFAAIQQLLRSWLPNGAELGHRIRILDASCGTGKVLEMLLDGMPPEMRRRVHIVANDVSISSIEAAKHTLARFSDTSIEYAQHDLTRRLPNSFRPFDLVLLSQTLALICDDRALIDQRLGKSIHSESRHTTAKVTLIRDLMGRLKTETGRLLIIGETPEILTNPADDPCGIIEEALFREIFRPINRDQLTSEVMKRMDQARFSWHGETPIDRRHGTYAVAYTKTPKNPATVPKPSIDHEDEIMRFMLRACPILTERLGEFTGMQFRQITNMDRDVLIIDRAYYEANILGKPGYWQKNGTRSLVVVSGIAHELGKDGYERLIANLKNSGKVKAGSVMLFIDTWPTPQTTESKDGADIVNPRPVRNSEARLIMNSFDDHVFLTSFRSGDKYGYAYAIREL